MKFIKKKGHDNTVRTVMDDDKTIVHGVVGTVNDLLKEGILNYCGCEKDIWCFIPKSNKLPAKFGKTREDVTENIN